MARILVLDSEKKRTEVLEASFNGTHELQRASELPTLAQHIAVAIIVMREPIQVYLNAIRSVKIWPESPKVLAVFGSGNLPADYTLMAAQAYGADAVLYPPHSDTEFIDCILSLFEPN
jgi:hypothetical protein